MSDADDNSETGSDLSLSRNPDVYQNPQPPAEGPYLEIVEQPQSRGFRFRYACEGKSHGGLQGVNSRREKKSYPSVRINRYKGPAKIEVSLVTDESKPKPHAHELIGKNCVDGKCSINIKGDSMSVSFPNLGIRHVTKKSVQEILTRQHEEQMKFLKRMAMYDGSSLQLPELSEIQLTAEEKCTASDAARNQAKTIQLSVVRLCFTAFLPNSFGQFVYALPPIVSQAIFDSKAPCTSLLKICRMDKVGGCCTGNEEVFLLCDKVQKDDIAVRFFEQDEEGRLKWEGFGNFAPHDVHRQYAIVFKTPPYLDNKIERPVVVQVQLQRCSDCEVSDPKTFTYYPRQTDLEDIQKKRKKQIPNFGDEHVFPVSNGFFTNSNVTVNQTGPTDIFGGNSQQYDSHQSNGFGRSVNMMHNFVSSPTSFNFFGNQDVDMSRNCQTGAASLIPQSVVLLESDSAESFDYQQSPSYSIASQNYRTVQQQNYLTTNLLQSRSAVSRSGNVLTSRGCVVKTGVPPVTDAAESIVNKQATTIPAAEASVVKSRSDSQLSILAQAKSMIGQADKTESSSMIHVHSSDEIKECELVDSFKIEITDNTAVIKTSEVNQNKNNIEKLPDSKPTVSQIETEKAANKRLVSLQALASLFACALHGYAMTGDTKHLIYPSRRLLVTQNEDGDNPLHLAVIHTQRKALLNFLSVLATLPLPEAINDRNTLKQSPLYLSVITEQVELVEVLLKCGADCFFLDKNGNTLLHITAKCGYEPCLEKLLKRWSNLSKDRAWHPCIDSLNYEGFSALHLAVRHEQVACMKLLLELGGANVNLKDGSSGRTALHHAVDVGNLSIVAHLITEGHADVDAARYDGNTALHMAVSENKSDIASVLVAAGANTEAVNFEQESSDSEEEEVDDVDIDGDIQTDGDENTELLHHGITPKELARGNVKMLGILNCESLPTSDRCMTSLESLTYSDSKQEKQLKSVCDSGIDSIKCVGRTELLLGAGEPLTSSAAQQNSVSSDIHNLDPELRVRLARLLDPVKTGSDWHELAQKLHLGSLTDVLQHSKSPTQVLLDNYAERGGTVRDVRHALIQMKRKDAVDLLDKNSQ